MDHNPFEPTAGQCSAPPGDTGLMHSSYIRYVRFLLVACASVCVVAAVRWVQALWGTMGNGNAAPGVSAQEGKVKRQAVAWGGQGESTGVLSHPSGGEARRAQSLHSLDVSQQEYIPKLRTRKRGRAPPVRSTRAKRPPSIPLLPAAKAGALDVDIDPGAVECKTGPPPAPSHSCDGGVGCLLHCLSGVLDARSLQTMVKGGFVDLHCLSDFPQPLLLAGLKDAGVAPGSALVATHALHRLGRMTDAVPCMAHASRRLDQWELHLLGGKC